MTVVYTIRPEVERRKEVRTYGVDRHKRKVHFLRNTESNKRVSTVRIHKRIKGTLTV